MRQARLFGLSDHLKRLSAYGDPLEALQRIVDFDIFRPTLVAALAYGDGTKGGRPPSPRLTGMGHSLGLAAASVCGMATGLCEIDLPSA